MMVSQKIRLKVHAPSIWRKAFFEIPLARVRISDRQLDIHSCEVNRLFHSIRGYFNNEQQIQKPRIDFVFRFILYTAGLDGSEDLGL